MYVVEPAVVVICCCAPPAAGLLRARLPVPHSKHSEGSRRRLLSSGIMSQSKSFGMISSRFRRNQGAHSESSEALELGPTFPIKVQLSQSSTRVRNGGRWVA